MGVDYSTTIGYGVIVDDDRLPAILEQYSDGGYFDEESAAAFFEVEGFSHIEYDRIGNWMNGPTYAFFHLPRTRIRGDMYEIDGVHKFDNADLTGQELREFRILQELLDIDGLPTWVVSFNVS